MGGEEGEQPQQQLQRRSSGVLHRRTAPEQRSAAQPRRARLSRARRKFRSSRGEKKCEHPQEARWGTERCPVLPDSLQQNAHLAWSSFLCRERGGQVANDLTRLVLYKG